MRAGGSENMKEQRGDERYLSYLSTYNVVEARITT